MKLSTSLLIALSMATAAIAGPHTHSPKGPVQVVEPAEPFSYSNLTIGWLHTEFDSEGLNDADGVGAAIEFAIHPNLYLAASGAWESVDSDFGDIDVAGASVGVGAHYSLCKDADLVVEVGANYEDVDDFDDDFGVYVAPHVRTRLGPVEAHLGAFYSSVFDGEWVGFVSFFVPVIDNVDLALGANLGDDYWGFSVGGRIRF